MGETPPAPDSQAIDNFIVCAQSCCTMENHYDDCYVNTPPFALRIQMTVPPGAQHMRSPFQLLGRPDELWREISERLHPSHIRYSAPKATFSTLTEALSSQTGTPIMTGASKQIETPPSRMEIPSTLTGAFSTRPTTPSTLSSPRTPSLRTEAAGQTAAPVHSRLTQTRALLFSRLIDKKTPLLNICERFHRLEIEEIKMPQSLRVAKRRKESDSFVKNGPLSKYDKVLLHTLLEYIEEEMMDFQLLEFDLTNTEKFTIDRVQFTPNVRGVTSFFYRQWDVYFMRCAYRDERVKVRDMTEMCSMKFNKTIPELLQDYINYAMIIRQIPSLLILKIYLQKMVFHADVRANYHNLDPMQLLPQCVINEMTVDLDPTPRINKARPGAVNTTETT